jgi:hypothetical protein
MFREIQALSLSGRVREPGDGGDTSGGKQRQSMMQQRHGGEPDLEDGVDLYGDGDAGDLLDDDDDWETRLAAMSARSQSTFLSGLDGERPGTGGEADAGGGGGGDRDRLARIRKRRLRRGQGKHDNLFEFDDTSLPDAKLVTAMRARLSTAQAELQEYEERRMGVGKALAFIGQLERGVMEMCELDDSRTRSKFEQAARLDEQAELRRAAEAKCRAAELAATSQDSTVQTLAKRVFVLEKQHDQEAAAYVDGFVKLSRGIAEREAALVARLAAMSARVAGISVSVRRELDERRRLRDAADAASRQTFMDPEEYIKSEPLSAKGIKAYLLLHAALVEAKVTIATRDKTIATMKKENGIQLFHIQRKLREVTEERAALKVQLAAATSASASGSLKRKV